LDQTGDGRCIVGDVAFEEAREAAGGKARTPSALSGRFQPLLRYNKFN
jgi:hypothetical protein